VDPEDRDPALAARCPGLDDARASSLLGLRTGGLGYWVAAVRETFEEAGVLLARSAATGDLVDPEAPGLADLRTALNEGATTWRGLVESLDLVLDVGGLHAFSHWITPEGAPRRYDTRFFLAAAPPNQTPLHDDHEVIANEWVRPADAIARVESGELTMMPPTIASLKAIARFETAADALAAATEIVDVPTILPRVIATDGGVRIVLPGDPAYDDPGGSPDASLRTNWMHVADARKVTGFGAAEGT
jgi:8-oxo-dGTP pyrophosphatase MutT (NUDIX family)